MLANQRLQTTLATARAAEAQRQGAQSARIVPGCY